MIIYEITLPKKQDAALFAEFMQKEYFPAVFKGLTRVGQVTDLLLLQGSEEANGNDKHHFFWQVGWNGLTGGNAHVEDKEIERKFELFNASVRRIGTFEEVASVK